MIARTLYLDRWVCQFFFATGGEDAAGICRLLRRKGVSRRVVERACELIESGVLNSGFTISNGAIRHSVVFIGPTSSGAEFLDTFVHELRHLINDIADSLELDLDAEAPAYMAGDAARALADVVCKLGCVKK